MYCRYAVQLPLVVQEPQMRRLIRLADGNV